MDSNSLRTTRRWDIYGWLAVVVLMLLYFLADLVNLDVLLPILIVPAIILFAVLVLPFLFKGRP